MDVNSLGFNSKSSYYEKSAHFINDEQPRWVAVWVESDDDKKLWCPLLKNTYSNINFKFYIASLHDFNDGKFSDGCSRIFAKINEGKIELGSSTIACLDSDYSYISGNYECKQKNLLESQYVFQTYVHSKENIYVHPIGIVQIFERALGEDLEQLGINIDAFTTKLSVSIYDYLIKLVSLYYSNDIAAFDGYHKKFVDSLKLIVNEMKIPDDLSSDLEVIFKSKLHGFDTELTQHIQNSHGDKIIDATAQRFKEIEVNPADSLNFIRGHDLYPVMMKIYKGIDQYVFKLKREQYCKKHLPEDFRRKKQGEMANKRVSIEDLICTRADIKDNQYFSMTLSKLNLMFG